MTIKKYMKLSLLPKLVSIMISTICKTFIQEAHSPYGHMSIRDLILTSCQRGAYLHINSPIFILNKNQQLYLNTAS